MPIFRLFRTLEKQFASQPLANNPSRQLHLEPSCRSASEQYRDWRSSALFGIGRQRILNRSTIAQSILNCRLPRLEFKCRLRHTPKSFIWGDVSAVAIARVDGTERFAQITASASDRRQRRMALPDALFRGSAHRVGPSTVPSQTEADLESFISQRHAIPHISKLDLTFNPQLHDCSRTNGFLAHDTEAVS